MYRVAEESACHFASLMFTLTEMASLSNASIGGNARRNGLEMNFVDELNVLVVVRNFFCSITVSQAFDPPLLAFLQLFSTSSAFISRP
jgi:hypothetical protein